jgi:hypothetical protein
MRVRPLLGAIVWLAAGACGGPAERAPEPGRYAYEAWHPKGPGTGEPPLHLQVPRGGPGPTERGALRICAAHPRRPAAGLRSAGEQRDRNTAEEGEVKLKSWLGVAVGAVVLWGCGGGDNVPHEAQPADTVAVAPQQGGVVPGAEEPRPQDAP